MPVTIDVGTRVLTLIGNNFLAPAVNDVKVVCQ